MNSLGLEVNFVVDQVYQRLISSGKAHTTPVPVDNSLTMQVYDSYIPLSRKFMIVQEVLDLVHMGILAQIKLKRSNPNNYQFSFDINGDYIILTEYGLQFIQNTSSSPYFIEEYLNSLRRAGEIDDDLQNYLSEGFACLHHLLPRAAAILLRAALERTLVLLIDSTLGAIHDLPQRTSLEQNIRKARNNIEERAETIFKKLESSTYLIPDNDYFRSMVTTRLRPAFHAIRDLGGRAVHKTDIIDPRDVMDHYTLYSSCVYAIIMQIKAHHESLKSS